MPTTDQRLAALEAVLFPPEPPVSAVKPAPAAVLVVGSKKYTANAGTLADLCRECGLDAKSIASAEAMGQGPAMVENGKLKPL